MSNDLDLLAGVDFDGLDFDVDVDFDAMLAANDEMIQDVLASLDDFDALAALAANERLDFDGLLVTIDETNKALQAYFETLANVDFDFGDFGGL